MAGGSEAAFAKAQPLFDIMGQKAVHCGGAGAGQSAKICNNMILGVTMIATCEAFALADKLGLDRQKMFDVVSTSSGYSWTMNAYCPAPGVGPKSPADNGYKPGFAADLMLKDLRLSQQAAEAVQRYLGVAVGARGKPVSEAWLLRQIHTACAALGIPRAGVHDTRRAFATEAFRGGVPLTLLARWLGHADVRTTEGYIVAYRGDQQLTSPVRVAVPG